jgi:mRNA-degrading endonuclease RelE of RelBE toxin-antitoxin system
MSDLKKHWTVRFSPVKGERGSPEDFVASIDSANDRANIYAKLKHVSTIKNHLEWSGAGAKRIEHRGERIHQLRQGNYRVYYFFQRKEVIVVHICRKQRGKAKTRDLDAAIANKVAYRNMQ